MAAITKLTRFQGVTAFTQIYAATSVPVLKSQEGVRPIHLCYAQLTGAMTINANVSGLWQFQQVFIHFATDGTERIVTFGTGFVSSGTLTIAASKDATVQCVFDGVNLKVVSREVQG